MPRPIPYDTQKEERTELDALLVTGAFSRSPHLARLLRYLCNEHWEGRTGEIKEYSLAVQALGRPPDFDPLVNPIVRVEMHRLREKLKKYYADEGSQHPVLIAFQPGSYTPRFIHRQEIAGRKRKHVWLTVSLIAASILLLFSIFMLPKLRESFQAHPNPAQIQAGASQAPVLVAGDGPIRIIAGYFKEKYISSSGMEFSGDHFFSGGGVHGEVLHSIARTRDPTIFSYGRTGVFSYDIPLKPGPHQLSLFFVDTEVGPGTLDGEGGENRDTFNVDLNGKSLLPGFDPYADVRGNFVADVRVFKDIEPASDGYLHLKFTMLKSHALLNALAIVPAQRRRMNPIRLVAQNNTFTDGSGQMWDPDSYVLGGRLTDRQDQVKGTPEPGLYTGERWGAFDYAIPVAEGKYAVTLHFAEAYWGSFSPGGVGTRVFDVYCNGVALLRNFDIFKEAGGADRALQKTFHGLQPNAQGKLMLTFVPIKNYASVNAIEVQDESD